MSFTIGFAENTVGEALIAMSIAIIAAVIILRNFAVCIFLSAFFVICKANYLPEWVFYTVAAITAIVVLIYKCDRHNKFKLLKMEPKVKMEPKGKK